MDAAVTMTGDAGDGGVASPCNLTMTVAEGATSVSFSTTSCSSTSANALTFLDGPMASSGSIQVTIQFVNPITSATMGQVPVSVQITETTADGGTLTYASPTGACQVTFAAPPVLDTADVDASNVYILHGSSGTCPAPDAGPLAIGAGGFSFTTTVQL
jgi:hypothetical protein